MTEATNSADAAGSSNPSRSLACVEDRRYALTAGQYVCFPAGQDVGHALINETDSPCRYLVFGNPQPHDVAVHTDSGRVGVKLMGEGYRRSATMDYREAVDGSGVDEPTNPAGSR